MRLEQLIAPGAFGGRGHHRNVTSITDVDSPYTLKVDDELIIADATNGPITINLPTVASNFQRVIIVKNDGDGSNAVTLDPDGTETVDGALTYVLAGADDAAGIVGSVNEWEEIFDALGAAATDHGLLAGLADDDHTQYILADGTRAFSGGIDMGGNLIDNAPFMRGFIDGLITENDVDTDHDIKVNPGVCADSLASNDKMIELTSAIVKRIDAAWAEGTNQGGMATGTVAADTEYNLIVIEKNADGTIDMTFDVSATGANTPANWTARRRIGSVLTDAFSNIRGYRQRGDLFRLHNTIKDIDDLTGMKLTFETGTLSIPPNQRAVFYIKGVSTLSTFIGVLVRHPDDQDESNSGLIVQVGGSSGTYQLNGWREVDVDGSSQIEYSLWFDGSWLQFQCFTAGWIDRRGRHE